MSEPSEPIAVMMTRKRWSAMLDHLNAEIQPKLEAGTATPEEIDIVVHLACALVHAGMARAEHAIVTYKLGLITPADVDLVESLREDASELLGERGWWADEPRHSHAGRYHELKERIAQTDELLDKLKGVAK
jgi:hypothetical protein